MPSLAALRPPGRGLALALALGTALPAFAALQWDATEIPLRVRSTDTAPRARLGFLNAGAKPVTITAVRPGCGCTVAALAKNTYAPGERGELAIEFHPGNREGLNRIDIAVATDDGETATLQLVADIETAVSFDNRFVFWKGAEPRTPKRMRLTFAEHTAGHIDSVTSSDPRFTVTSKPVGTTGRDFEIEVTPPATALNYTVISVRTRFGDDPASREFNLVARTMPEPAAAAAKP